MHAGIPPPLEQTPWEQAPPGADTPLGAGTPKGARHPPGADTPWEQAHPCSRHPPRSTCWEIRSTSGRYASYWNAILFYLFLKRPRKLKKNWSVSKTIAVAKLSGSNSSLVQFGFSSVHCQRLYYLFFLNLRVSRTKIENLKQQIKRDINHITFRKFVTLLVEKLKVLTVYKNCKLRY